MSEIDEGRFLGRSSAIRTPGGTIIEYSMGLLFEKDEEITPEGGRPSGWVRIWRRGDPENEPSQSFGMSPEAQLAFVMAMQEAARDLSDLGGEDDVAAKMRLAGQSSMSESVDGN